MVILDLLVYVYSFFLNPYQWGFRKLFPKYEGTTARGTPIPVSLCLGNGYFKPIGKQGYGREFLVWMQNRRCKKEEELEVSHLLYADDTLLFCKDNPDQLACLGWILMLFEALSGLKINLSKSKIFPIEGRENIEVLTAELGCKASSLPMTYLGLPLGAQHKSVGIWDLIEERFRRRLATWKRQYISKGGRVRWRLFFDLMLKAIQLSALSCLFFKIFMTYC